jgi:formylmethanofuran dehydrogenase subunit E
MVPQIVNALYPIFHPLEQQDCAIQARNHAVMTEIATSVWRNFKLLSAVKAIRDVPDFEVKYRGALPSEERRCQKCGAPTGGEEAFVDGQIWCHPCADAVPLEL